MPVSAWIIMILNARQFLNSAKNLDDKIKDEYLKVISEILGMQNLDDKIKDEYLKVISEKLYMQNLIINALFRQKFPRTPPRE